MVQLEYYGAVAETRTVGDVAPKVFADDDVPGGTVAPVKLFLNLRGDVLLDVVFFEGGRSDVDALLLHVLVHVDVLDGRLGAGATSCTADAGVGGSGGCVEFFGHCS
jgi:hypothetical protein